MEIKEIQEMIEFVSKSGVNEVSIENGDFKITIKTGMTPTVVHASIPQALPTAIQPVSQPQTITQSSEPVAAPVADTKTFTIKSPMIGTFYDKPSPEKSVFVKEGDIIKPGQVLCIVEAMKLFNEIESEVSGRVVKILVKNSSPIEFDQPLFIVEPA